LATLPPEVTRGNINGQLKAIAMFASFGGLFPQASATHPEQPTVKAHIYESAWHREQREQREQAASRQSNPALAQQNEEPALPSAEPPPAAAPDARNSGLDTGQNSVLNSVQGSILDHGPQTTSASGPVSDPPNPPGTRIPTFAELASSRFTSFVPDTSSGPDLRVPFSIDKTRFGGLNRFRNRR
jgi:hypothetical protein